MTDASPTSRSQVISWLADRTWPDTVALVLLALAVAGPGLGSPPVMVFDEVYYVSDAVSHLEVGVGRSFQAHPPLGTWIVAAGTWLLDSPAGWRLGSLALAAIAVAALHRLALRLLPPTTTGRALAAMAAVLLVSDGTWLVLARTAMLDGPLTAFGVLAVAAAVAATGSDGRRRTAFLVASGAAVGAAAAVKWSGALAGTTVLCILMLLDERGDRTRRFVRALPTLAVAAGLVYGAAWVPYAIARERVPVASCPVSAAPCPTTGGLSGVLAQHQMHLRYHRRIQTDSAAATPPSYWPLMREPIGFYRPDCHVLATPRPDPLVLADEQDCGEELPAGLDTILFSGNAVVWFGFVALLPLLAAATVTGDRAGRVSLVAWSLQWLPWLLVTRASYLWYLAPAIPFTAFGLVVATASVPSLPIARVYLGATTGAGLGVLLTALTPVPGAAAIVGWAVGGAALRLPTGRQARARERLAVAGLVTTAAAITAIVSHSTWTAGG